MTPTEIQKQQHNKIIKGLEKVYDKLIEFKKFKKSTLVLMQDDKIIHLKP